MVSPIAVKPCTKCNEVKLLSEFTARKASRDGLGYLCKGCQKAYRAENSEKYKSLRKNWHVKNIEREREKSLAYYHVNRESCLIKHREYKERNSGRMKEYRTLTASDYVARTAAYRAGKDSRTPKWLTAEEKERTKNMYDQAKRLTRETGVDHHVDHVFPLRGKRVSGLHVPSNLQILSAFENVSKGNKYEPS